MMGPQTLMLSKRKDLIGLYGDRASEAEHFTWPSCFFLKIILPVAALAPICSGQVIVCKYSWRSCWLQPTRLRCGSKPPSSMFQRPCTARVCIQSYCRWLLGYMPNAVYLPHLQAPQKDCSSILKLFQDLQNLFCFLFQLCCVSALRCF